MTKDFFALLSEAQEYGATFELHDEKVLLQAPGPLSSDLVEQLKNRKTEIQQYLTRKLSQDMTECWFLEEWRRISIPEWRNILKQSVVSNDRNREEYARWMLKEILDDSEYRENNQ